jgi:hypothetical protein
LYQIIGLKKIVQLSNLLIDTIIQKKQKIYIENRIEVLASHKNRICGKLSVEAKKDISSILIALDLLD